MIPFYTMEITAPSNGGEFRQMLPTIYTNMIIDPIIFKN
jgi:hypothetical protein